MVFESCDAASGKGTSWDGFDGRGCTEVHAASEDPARVVVEFNRWTAELLQLLARAPAGGVRATPRNPATMF